MKHIFQVHSTATYEAALAVYRHRQLAPSSCIFVPVRGFTCSELPEGVTSACLSARSGFAPLSLRTIRRNLYTLRKADVELDEVLRGEKFEFYVPQTWHDASHLVISHKSCSAFSFIEEGWTSYYKAGAVERAYPTRGRTLRAQMLRLAFFGNRLPSKLSFFRSGYNCAYGFTDMSFPSWKNRVTLGLPPTLHRLPRPRPQAAPLLVFDALVELKKSTIEAVLQSVARLLELLAEEGETCLRYKFHGAQTKAGSKSRILELFASYASRIQFVELEAGASLEALVSREDFVMYIFNSAAGLYASLAGNTVVSINEFVLEADPTYKDQIAALPDVFSSLIAGVGARHVRRAPSPN